MQEVVMPRQTPIYCRHESKDGNICSLYKDHYGLHKSDHGKASWGDDA